MNGNKVFLAAGLAVVAAAAPAPVLAHHSFAMFDTTKTITLQGTVKEFQWTSPHAWLQLLVKDSSGKVVEWSLEASGPSQLVRFGWRRTSLKPGDKVKVEMNPLRDGSLGGAMKSMTKADGSTLPTGYR